MVLSLAAHCALAWLVVHFFVPSGKRHPEAIAGIELVEAPAGDFTARDEPWMVPSRPQRLPTPRSGDPHERPTRRPADALSRAHQAGAAGGAGEPRPRPRQLVGDDLDDLRFRPYDHPRRDTPRRRRTAQGEASTSPDNRQASPARSGVELPAPAGGSTNPAVAVHQYDDEPGAPPAEHSRSDRVWPSPRPGAHLAPTRRARARADAAARTPTTGAPTTSPAMRVVDPMNRQAASPTKLPDLVDMARASGAGTSATGGGWGARAGRRGDPRGHPEGEPIWLNTPDDRYVSYLRRIHRKVQPLWRFPSELELLMEQGEVLVQFTVLADGRVIDLSVRKSSGFPRFDRVATAAIRRAAPFDPIPRRLGPRLSIIAPFEFSNPMVR